MASTRPLVFATDELPESFPKHLRRPLSDRQLELHKPSNERSLQDSAYGSLEHDENGNTHMDNPDQLSVSGTPDHQAESASRMRIIGGRSALPKRVTVDLDSDDEIIKEMKDQGQPDADVMNRLIKEGRTLYAEKSISTRYARIKKVFDNHENELLDEDLSDWHEGDDEMLAEAYRENENSLNTEIEKLRTKHWQSVANSLKSKMPAPRFSKNACKDRFEAIQAGTARPPLELDPDQAGRMAERAVREAERTRRKAEAEAKAVVKAEEKRQTKETARLAAVEDATRKAEKEAARVAKREQTEAEKARKAKERAARLLEQQKARDEEVAARKEKVADQKRQKKHRAQMKLNQKQAKKHDRDNDRRARAQAEVKKTEELRLQAQQKLDTIALDRDTKTILSQSMMGLMGECGSDKDAAESIVTPSASYVDKLGDTVPTDDDEEDFMTMPATADPADVGTATDASTLDKVHAKNESEISPVSVVRSPYYKLTQAILVRLCLQRKLPTYGDKTKVILRLVKADNDMNSANLASFYADHELKAVGTVKEQRQFMTSVLAKEAADKYKTETPKKRHHNESPRSEPQSSSRTKRFKSAALVANDSE